MRVNTVEPLKGWGLCISHFIVYLIIPCVRLLLNYVFVTTLVVNKYDFSGKTQHFLGDLKLLNGSVCPIKIIERGNVCK